MWLDNSSFLIVEYPDTDVDVDLFSETVISVASDKHYGHRVIASVTRNLFRAIGYYIYHKFFSPSAPVEGRRTPAACDKKEICFV